MHKTDLIGFVSGVVLASLGLRFVPSSAVFDPEGLGPCGVSGVFPVLLPETPVAAAPEPEPEPGTTVHHFGFVHYYDCSVQPSTALLVAVYFAFVFVISGALASRIGETTSPNRGVLAVGLVAAPVVLNLAIHGERIDVLATTLVGMAVFSSAICCAYLGGLVAKQHA